MTVFHFVLRDRNTSNFKTENSIYIRPYALSVLVQPSDGEVGKELPIQPQLIFLDKQVTCSQIMILKAGQHVLSADSIVIVHTYRVPPEYHLLHLELLLTSVILLPLHCLLSFCFIWMPTFLIKSENTIWIIFLPKQNFEVDFQYLLRNLTLSKRLNYI